MDELFIPTELSTSISIESRNINNKLDDIITKKLKNNMEGKCVKNGYIRFLIVSKSSKEVWVVY